MLMRVSVAVPRPLAGSFDYLCHEPIAVGARVRVPFGRGQVIGVVVAVAPDALDDGSLKTVARVLDDAPLLDAPLLQLLHFAARYYQHPLGEVVQAALPKLLREGRAATRDLPRYWRIT
ncbi:putative primosomal protein N', partial [Cardiobacterium hominis ATCC 15826]